MKRKTKTRLVQFIFVLSVFFCAELKSDVIYLKNQQIVEGKIIDENSERVVVDLGYDKISYTRDEIDNIEKKENITKCTHVISGDTIEIYGGERVRLIGIDTPRGWDKQASDYTKKWLEGRCIRLEYDPNNEHINHKDKYGRLLAYVYVELNTDSIPEKYLVNHIGKLLSECPGIAEIEPAQILYLYEIFFNAQIIYDGYAYAYTKFPFKYVNDFRRYEQEAREKHRGLWAGEDFQ